jgi:predicted O-methyltransferase YrrM
MSGHLATYLGRGAIIMAKQIWNPGTLIKLSGSYWETFTLHAGVKLELFTILGTGSMGSDEIAAEAGTDVRGTTFLLNALAALGLLIKEDQVYRNTSSAKKFLDRNSKDYIGHMIMHHHHLVEAWSRMDEVVRKGEPLSIHKAENDKEQRREAFLMGMYNIASQQAPQISAEIDLSHRRRLLDLGGGPGTYAISFCKKNPDLEAVIYDMPTTQPFAEKTVAMHGLSDRIRFRPGNFTTDQLGGPFDVVWLSHILHAEGMKTCKNLIKKAVGALSPGGMILIHDFFLNDTMDGPVFPALFALNMLQATKEGQSYSEYQVRKMMGEAGIRDIQRLAYLGPTESGILQGHRK